MKHYEKPVKKHWANEGKMVIVDQPESDFHGSVGRIQHFTDNEKHGPAARLSMVDQGDTYVGLEHLKYAEYTWTTSQRFYDEIWMGEVAPARDDGVANPDDGRSDYNSGFDAFKRVMEDAERLESGKVKVTLSPQAASYMHWALESRIDIFHDWSQGPAHGREDEVRQAAGWLSAATALRRSLAEFLGDHLGLKFGTEETSFGFHVPAEMETVRDGEQVLQ